MYKKQLVYGALLVGIVAQSLCASTESSSSAPVEQAPWFADIKDKSMLRFNYGQIFNLLHKAREELAKKFDLAKTNNFLVTNDLQLSIAGFKTIGNIDELDPSQIKDSVFIVYFHTDNEYFNTLKKIKDNRGIYYSLPYYSAKTRYLWVDKNAMRAVDYAFSFGTKISHQNVDVHEIICQCLHLTKDLPGDYMEIGVYMGGSALTALAYMKFAGIQRNAYFLDTFNGMTYEEAHQSSDLIWDNTHVLWGVENTMKYVAELLQTTGRSFELVESNICKSELPARHRWPNPLKQIAVCNIDVDLYEATLAALTKVAPLVVKGGIIICEDPTSTPTLCGALLAMDEFLMTEQGKKFIKVLVGAQYLLIKMHE